MFIAVQCKVVQCRLRLESLKHCSSVEVIAVQYCPVKCISLRHESGNVCTARCNKLKYNSCEKKKIIFTELHCKALYFNALH